MALMLDIFIFLVVLFVPGFTLLLFDHMNLKKKINDLPFKVKLFLFLCYLGFIVYFSRYFILIIILVWFSLHRFLMSKPIVKELKEDFETIAYHLKKDFLFVYYLSYCRVGLYCYFLLLMSNILKRTDLFDYIFIIGLLTSLIELVTVFYIVRFKNKPVRHILMSNACYVCVSLGSSIVCTLIAGAEGYCDLRLPGAYTFQDFAYGYTSEKSNAINATQKLITRCDLNIDVKRDLCRIIDGKWYGQSYVLDPVKVHFHRDRLLKEYPEYMGYYVAEGVVRFFNPFATIPIVPPLVIGPPVIEVLDKGVITSEFPYNLKRMEKPTEFEIYPSGSKPTSTKTISLLDKLSNNRWSSREK
jgi:hypothetical protein